MYQKYTSQIPVLCDIVCTYISFISTKWLYSLYCLLCFLFFSRPLLDVYEYNSEESNVDKVFREIVTEEKRSHSRAGCDCQLSVSGFLRGRRKNNKEFPSPIEVVSKHSTINVGVTISFYFRPP